MIQLRAKVDLGAMAIKEYSVFPPNTSIAGTSPSDCLVSYTGQTLVSYREHCRIAIGVFCSPSRLGHCFLCVCYCVCGWVCVCVCVCVLGWVKVFAIFWLRQAQFGSSWCFCWCRKGVTRGICLNGTASEPLYHECLVYIYIYIYICLGGILNYFFFNVVCDS